MEASTQDTKDGTTTDDVDHPMSGVNYYVRGSSGTRISPGQPLATVDESSVYPNDGQIPPPADLTSTFPDAANSTRDSVDPSSISRPPAFTQGNETQPGERQSRTISFEGMCTRDH